jgi:hypothetical protein
MCGAIVCERRSMEYSNERLDEWVGRLVLLEYVMGPTEELDRDDEEFEQLFREPGAGVKHLMQARAAVVMLEGYDQIGLTVSTLGGRTRFVPWGAVISIQGE